MSDEATCCVCGAPAARTLDGNSYCAAHGIAHRNPAPPLALCELDGCGSPAAPGSRGCRFHQPYLDGQLA